MKKILLVFVIIITMGFIASAQSDGFFRGGSDDYDGGSRDISTAMPGLPQGTVGSSNNDQSAPVGSGLLILSMLGGVYIIRKKTSNL